MGFEWFKYTKKGVACQHQKKYQKKYCLSILSRVIKKDRVLFSSADDVVSVLQDFDL